MKISPYNLLEFPFIYSLSQKLLALGAESLTKKHFGRVFSESNVNKGLVLDVGCGPELSTPQPHGTIIGVDINPFYVKKFFTSRVKKKLNNISNNHAYLGAVSSADALPFKKNTFNESRCNGLLHHMPSEPALRSIKEMIRCTEPGGMVVIIDNVWPGNPFFRPIAWLTRKLDRGKWVRTEKELLRLVNDVCKESCRHKRITYTYTGLELLIIKIKKA